jgi:hypothetical protein
MHRPTVNSQMAAGESAGVVARVGGSRSSETLGGGLATPNQALGGICAGSHGGPRDSWDLVLSLDRAYSGSRLIFWEHVATDFLTGRALFLWL